MFSYKINRFCCFISMIAAVVSAVTDHLGFLFLNFFFAVFNWYISEWKRGQENEKDDNNQSDD